MSAPIIIRQNLSVSSTISTPQITSSGYTGDGLPVISIPYNTNMFIHLVTAGEQQSNIRVCQHCELAYDMNVQGTISYGIPVKFELIESKEGLIKRYTLEGNCNTPQCAYAIYKKKQGNTNIIYRDAIYQDSESLFKMLMYDLTGSDTITEAPPVSLLQSKGGKFTPEQYFASGAMQQYFPMTLLEIKQVTQQFLRI